MLSATVNRLGFIHSPVGAPVDNFVTAFRFATLWISFRNPVDKFVDNFLGVKVVSTAYYP